MPAPSPLGLGGNAFAKRDHCGGAAVGSAGARAGNGWLQGTGSKRMVGAESAVVEEPTPVATPSTGRDGVCGSPQAPQPLPQPSANCAPADAGPPPCWDHSASPSRLAAGVSDEGSAPSLLSWGDCHGPPPRPPPAPGHIAAASGMSACAEKRPPAHPRKDALQSSRVDGARWARRRPMGRSRTSRPTRARLASPPNPPRAPPALPSPRARRRRRRTVWRRGARRARHCQQKKATKYALSLMAMPSECISIIMAAVAYRSFPPAGLSCARERFRFFFGGRARRRLGGAIAIRRARSAPRANETGARGTADVHFAALIIAGKNATAQRGERTALARGGGDRGGVRGRHSSASERPLASYLPRLDLVFARPYGQGRRRARNADEANEGHHSLLTSGGMGCVRASEPAQGPLVPACAAVVRLARDARRATADRRLFLCCAARVCA